MIDGRSEKRTIAGQKLPDRGQKVIDGEKTIHPWTELQKDPPPEPEPALDRDEAVATDHQVEEERRVDRHADWERQVKEDKEHKTNEK